MVNFQKSIVVFEEAALGLMTSSWVARLCSEVKDKCGDLQVVKLQKTPRVSLSKKLPSYLTAVYSEEGEFLSGTRIDPMTVKNAILLGCDRYSAPRKLETLSKFLGDRSLRRENDFFCLSRGMDVIAAAEDVAIYLEAQTKLMSQNDADKVKGARLAQGIMTEIIPQRPMYDAPNPYFVAC